MNLWVCGQSAFCPTKSGDVLVSTTVLIIGIFAALGVGACSGFFVLALFSVNKCEECPHRCAKPTQNDEPHESMQHIHDKCVYCGGDTEYDVDAPITERKFYVSGCGQLCKSCYTALEYEISNANKQRSI